jgi:hypothetical protein
MNQELTKKKYPLHQGLSGAWQGREIFEFLTNVA